VLSEARTVAPPSANSVRPAEILHVLHVFGGPEGGGNALGVVLDGDAVAPGERQRMARELGYSETVFVDDPAAGRVQIFTPATELAFAGHPLVGTAWLLERHGYPADVMRPPAGEVPARREGGLCFVAGRPEWAPRFSWHQLGSPGEVDALSAPERGLEAFWAWADEAAGRVRARVFPRDLGIEEDEATGAAAVVLGAELGRPLEIHQGRGSLIRVSPRPDGLIEIGGRVE